LWSWFQVWCVTFNSSDVYLPSHANI
jgi:hypothetical protein